MRRSQKSVMSLCASHNLSIVFEHIAHFYPGVDSVDPPDGVTVPLFVPIKIVVVVVVCQLQFYHIYQYIYICV